MKHLFAIIAASFSTMSAFTGRAICDRLMKVKTGMRTQALLVLLACICISSTGCIRMAVAGMSTAASAMGPRPGPSVMVTDKYLDGTRHVAPMVLSPLAPIAIIDLPFEIVWDVLLIPMQLGVNSSRREYDKRRISEMSPALLAQYGNYDEFRKRIAQADPQAIVDIMANLARQYAQEHEKYRPYIDLVYQSKAMKECGEFALDSLNFREETEVTSRLFELGLRPSDYPMEHAVFNAVNCIHHRFHASYLVSPTYSTESQLKRIRILLENGCNPNSIPEYDCKYIKGQQMYIFKSETALDMAWEALDRCKLHKYEEEAAPLEEIVNLLEKHGAKTAKELNLSPFFMYAKLKDFYFNRDFERYKLRMKYASRREKEEEMERIMFTGDPIDFFEPYCRLLLADGIPFPASLIESTPPPPRIVKAVEFAFANALKASDYPQSPVVQRLCQKVCQDCMIYDPNCIELLNLLLKNGCSPNTTWHPDEQTALSILLEGQLRPNTIVLSPIVVASEVIKSNRRMVLEMIEIVKQYGGVASTPSKK